MLASTVVHSAEAIAELVVSLPPNSTKCCDLGEKVSSLLNLARPLVVLDPEILEKCQFCSALEKLQLLLTSLDVFLKSASHLISHGFEEGLDSTIGMFIARLDKHTGEFKVLEDRRCELVRQEKEFCNALQHQYIEDPPLQDFNDDRALISEGRFGEIFRMNNTSAGVTYAVKRLRLELLAPLGVTVATLAEQCEGLLTLSIPHIGRYSQMFLSKEERFFNIAMELVEGDSLAEKVVCIPTPTESEVVEWTWQMASALSYMHSAGVLHRDLRPENIILTQTGEIKLVGLQIPCLPSAASLLTVYTSFERVAGLRYDCRDDVWAMGCILLELLNRARLKPILLSLRSCIIYYYVFV
jgi:hypothetical protein